MKGRKPKDPDERERRNRASTATDLKAESHGVKAPPLNAEILGIKGRVKAPVARWWKVVWQSPMAPRWLETDVEVLYLCANIRQQMAVFVLEGKPITTLASELRQQESRIGLDVMSRRRLDWRVEGSRTAPAPDAEKPSPAPEPPRQPAVDPRSILRAVG